MCSECLRLPSGYLHWQAFLLVGWALRSTLCARIQKRIERRLAITHQTTYFDVRQGIALCAAPDLQGGGFYAQEIGRLDFIAKWVKYGLSIQGIPLHFPDNTRRVSFGYVKEFPAL